MASQYQHRQFFRRVPNLLLAKYFEAKGIPLDVDFGKLKETEVEPIFAAFTALPEDTQSAVEVDFQDINALASEGGISALLNQAMFYENLDFQQEIATIDGFHAKAMWAFLHEPDYWQGASSLLHADNVSVRFWKKLSGLPKIPTHIDTSDIQAFEESIGRYFFNAEIRGRNCMVEFYRKVETDKEYFFAYPEDYSQSDPEWESRTLTTRSRHPAFEIIFVYSESEGSLDIYAPKNSVAVDELRRIFAKTILKLDTLPDGSIDKREYDLDLLADSNFEFQFPEETGIQQAIVTKLRLSLKYGPKRRIVLEADTKHNPMAVYDLLKELNPPDYFISQVSIQAVFAARPGKRTGSKTFTITYPNSCNLNHIGRDNLIRKMLIASNIEPQLPNSDSDG